MTVPAFVQSKLSNAGAWVGGTSNGDVVPNGYGDPDIRYLTLDAPPTAGNRLFLLIGYEDPRFPFDVLLAGWSIVSLVPDEAAGNTWGLYSRVVAPGESATVLVAYNHQGRGYTVQGIYHIVEYSGLGTPDLDVVTWAENTLTFASVSPAVATLLLAFVYLQPHWVPTWPAGWTERTRTTTAEGQTTLALGEMVAAPGTHNGTLTVGGSLSSGRIGIDVASVAIVGGGSQILTV